MTTGTASHTPSAQPAPGIDAYRLALLVFATLAAYIFFSFDQHGISNDEEVQHVYGRLLLDFYTSGFTDHSAFQYKNLYLYGGMFDMIAAALERVIPLNVWDLRHLLAAGFGLLGLIATWLLARLLMGETAGLLALVLLALTGAWSGAMFTHTKDVPFAATMVWSLYFTTRFIVRLPTVRWVDQAGLGLALGCAFGLRVGAVFAVFYLAVSVLAVVWLNGRCATTRLAALRHAMLALVPPALLAFALTGLFWPWAVLSFGNLVQAMTTFARFTFELDTILDGSVMKIGALPGHYLVTYLLVRLPELFLLGLALALSSGMRVLRNSSTTTATRQAALPWLPVTLAVSVPLAYSLLAAPPLYNGIRHFTFLLPPLAVLGGAGLHAAWRGATRWPRVRQAGAAACLVVALAHAVTLVRLHPYEYVAYNSLAGGLRGTEGRWEQDYWSDSVRAAVSMLNGYVSNLKTARRTYSVAVCAEPIQAAAWLAQGLKVTRNWNKADFFLSATQMNCHKALQGRIIGEIARDGTPLAVVRDRRDLTGTDRQARSPE
ncbi:MAG: glycosyltransferase family 39 protein [Rhodocyclales bacterium]|nr:glycosyltransferase family 39 protein [Rhodocyclales bacterium]